MIIVQSPLRVSFFGGGTDFPHFYLEEGGCVLSSTIDKYIFITVKNRRRLFWYTRFGESARFIAYKLSSLCNVPISDPERVFSFE